MSKRPQESTQEEPEVSPPTKKKSDQTHFVIGSRQSQLALIQTQIVLDSLQKSYPDYTFEIKKMTTKGDNVIDVALSKIGDKGLFTKELEDSLLDGTIDFAVHSLKDLPTRLPLGMVIGAVTKREVEGDVAIFRKSLDFKSLEDLPKGSVVGSSSLRRIAQLKHAHPDLTFKDIRGNVNTRFRKLDDPTYGYDVLVLAQAGLQRMGNQFSDRISVVLEDIYWAPGQGALAVEARENDTSVLNLLKVIHDEEAHATCTSERAFLDALGGGCQVPLGVKSSLSSDGSMVLKGRVLNLEGTMLVEGEATGTVKDPKGLGNQLADVFKLKGADAILGSVRGK